MITYDVHVHIGRDNTDKDISVKCHDTGVNLRIFPEVVHHVAAWRDEVVPYTIPEGATAILKLAKPDKTFVVIDGDITADAVLFKLPPQSFTVSGKEKAEVSFIDADSRRLTSATFVISIDEECVCNCNTESESYVDVFAEEIADTLEAYQYVTEHADELQAVYDSEDERQQNETTRVNAENARNTAESERAAAENARNTAESERAAAENARNTAESDRNESEQARWTNEESRIDAEKARSESETQRAEAEQNRAMAETNRVTAESMRASAEAQREAEQGVKLAAAQAAQEGAENAKAGAEASETNAAGYAAQSLNNMLNGVSTHNANANAHSDIRSEITRIENIARGRATAHTFDTYDDMVTWLANADNTASLQSGDNLYIRAIGLHDWWWDGQSAQELEAENPDLTDYPTKVEMYANLPLPIEQADYDALVNSGTVQAGRIYYVVPDGTLEVDE